MADSRDSLLTAEEVAGMLHVSRRTVYNIPWLLGRRVYVNSAPRWKRQDVELYIANQQAYRKRVAS